MNTDDTRALPGRAQMASLLGIEARRRGDDVRYFLPGARGCLLGVYDDLADAIHEGLRYHRLDLPEGFTGPAERALMGRWTASFVEDAHRDDLPVWVETEIAHWHQLDDDYQGGALKVAEALAAEGLHATSPEVPEWISAEDAEAFLLAAARRLGYDDTATPRRALYGLLYSPKVVTGEQPGSCSPVNSIQVGPSGARPEDLLHQLAHHMCPTWEHHGPTYAAVLGLVWESTWSGAGSLLLASYRACDVEPGPETLTEEHRRVWVDLIEA